MKNLTILLVLLILAFNINAQTTPPSIQWQRSLGGTGDDVPYSIQQTIDGGYIIAGHSTSNDSNVSGNHDTSGTYGDYWIVKIDTIGNIQWQKCLGGSLDDQAYSIQQTNDGGYIVAGGSESNDGDVTGHHGTTTNWDVWVVKLDTSGNIQWQKSLGGSGDDEAVSIQQTSDGGYIIGGGSSSNDGNVTGNHYDYMNNCNSLDYWVVKLDSSGNIQWQKSLGGSGSDGATSIEQTTDGGFVVAGYTYSNDGDVTGLHSGAADIWVVKIDSSGNIQWQKCLGGSYDDFAYSSSSIRQTLDGGYIIAGFTFSNDGDVTGNHDTTNCYEDYWIVKLDSIGHIQWEKCLGGTSTDREASVQQTNDSGYIVIGCSFSNNGDVTNHHGLVGTSDCWVVKLDIGGNILWQKSFGGTNNEANTYFSSVQQTIDGGFIFATTSNSNNGDVSGNHGGYDYWIVKLGSAPLEIKGQKLTSNISIYPNPSERNFTVNVPVDAKYIEISNSLGQVMEKRYVFHEERVNFEIKDDGFYFVRILTDKESITKKVVISK